MLERVFVDILLVLCAFGAGWVAAVLKVWGLGRRTTDLEYRLEDLETRVTREVKMRSGQAGQSQKQADKDLLEWAKNQTDAPAQPQTPTVKPLMDWRRDKMTGPK